MKPMPVLRVWDCGCTSGHDSLIRLWMPQNYDREDFEQVKGMWELMMRVLERGITDHEQTEIVGEGPIPSAQSSENESVDKKG